MRSFIICIFCISLFLSLCGYGQSIEINPSNSNPINVKNNTSFVDLRKTGTENHSGLRFYQNNTNKGGLFYNDQKEHFNLSGNINSAGIIWNRTLSRMGVGVYDPEASVHILTNSTASLPHILVSENSNTDGARINFENTFIAKRWTLYGGNADNPTFNIYHSDAGNVAQFYGDGNAKLTGYTQLGADAPKIKIKKLAGTTANSSSQEISTGIAFDKIIDFQVYIETTVQDGLTTSRYKFKPANNNISGNDYRAFLRRITNPLQLNNFGWIQFENVSNTLRQQPYLIIITYEE